MNPAIEKFWESMQGVQQRAKHGIEAIEMEISRKEVELDELRKTLSEAQKILYVVDPSSKPKPKPRSRSGGATNVSNGKRVGVSEEKIEALVEWLRQTVASDETFSGPEIMASESFNLMSEPTVRGALEILHERGVIVLDHVGGEGGKGNRRKNYRLVS